MENIFLSTNLVYSPLDQFEIVNLISLTSPLLGNIRIGMY